jgi:hypothetical protein
MYLCWTLFWHWPSSGNGTNFGPSLGTETRIPPNQHHTVRVTLRFRIRFSVPEQDALLEMSIPNCHGVDLGA